MLKKPLDWVTWPRPWQRPQTWVEVPGAHPDPWQEEQSAYFCTVISVVAPRAASMKEIRRSYRRSAPALAACLWALKGAAPTRLAWSGAGAGLLAGALGTLVYALHCPEMAAPFLAVWYLLGMAIPTAVMAYPVSRRQRMASVTRTARGSTIPTVRVPIARNKTTPSRAPARRALAPTHPFGSEPRG